MGYALTNWHERFSALFLLVIFGMFSVLPVPLFAAKVESHRNRVIIDQLKKDTVIQLFLKRDYIGVFDFARHWAELGSPSAQSLLGIMYAGPKRLRNGKFEQMLAQLLNVKIGDGPLGDAIREDEWVKVPHDEARAFYWVEKAAKAGDVHGRFFLAAFYSAGIGVEKDRFKSAENLRKNATQGHKLSQRLLGVHMLAYGTSDQDRTEAYKWVYIAFHCYGDNMKAWEYFKDKFFGKISEENQTEGKRLAIAFARDRGEPCSEDR